MKYLLIFVIVFAVIIIFCFLGKKPYKYKIKLSDDFKKYFQVLLNRGFDQGALFIEIPKDKRFIQFSKYIERDKKAGLEFDFPMREWSKKYYENLKQLLFNAKIEFSLQKTTQGEVIEFINVDCKKDLDLAVKIVKIILKEIFVLKENDYAILYFKNVSPKDEKIGL